MALAQMEAPSPMGAMYVPSSFDESDREKKVGKEMIGKSSPIKRENPYSLFLRNLPRKVWNPCHE
jgi:hypothetical protein